MMQTPDLTLHSRMVRVWPFLFAALLLPGAAWSQTAGNSGGASELARVRTDIRNGAVNSLWKYDGYPDLQSLDAGATVVLAEIEGPAQINTMYIGEMMHWPAGEIAFTPADVRSIVLKIWFDGSEQPAVDVPLGDFFADGTGKAADFTTQFVEKSRGSYVSYIPMPFRKSARVTLTNEGDLDVVSYAAVEWQSLPRWEDDLGYFHAAWKRHAFQLTPDTRESFYRLDGPGHLVGQYWLIRTDEPLFESMTFVMEANNEIRIDGEPDPAINYLGSECAFNFGWGWQTVFNGYKVGVNQRNPAAGETIVSTYRFRDRDVIRFRESLALTLNWTGEFRTVPELQEILDRLRQRNALGGGWVDYAETTYWYSVHPEGTREPLSPLAERVKPLVHPNPAPAPD